MKGLLCGLGERGGEETQKGRGDERYCFFCRFLVFFFVFFFCFFVFCFFCFCFFAFTFLVVIKKNKMGKFTIISHVAQYSVMIMPMGSFGRFFR